MDACSKNFGLSSLSSDSVDLKLALELLLADTMRSNGLSFSDSDDELLDDEDDELDETRLRTCT